MSRSDQIVVFDLEWTTWEGAMARGWSGPGEHREVVEIGAVLLVAEDCRVISTFDELVLPKHNPVLSSYMTMLTGITNDRLQANGVSLGQALQRFSGFVGGRRLFCNGGDEGVVQESCLLQGLAFPPGLRHIVNLRPLLSHAIELPPEKCVSSRLPGLLGLDSTERDHTGLGDAIGIARALAELTRRGRLPSEWWTNSVVPPQ